MKPALILLLFPIFANADFEYLSSIRGAQGREQVTTVALHANRMVRKGATSSEITDLDKRSITTIDVHSRTWSVMTFDQLRNALSERLASSSGSPAVNMSAGIRPTGQARVIRGYRTKQSVFSVSTAGVSFDMHIWIAPEVPGYSEVRDFYRRMAKDFDWLPGAAAIRDRTGIARLAGRLMSQSSLLAGTPIETVIAIRSAGESAGASPSMEMTIENSSFSSAPVDPALFEIPAGFSETPSGRGALRLDHRGGSGR